MSKEEENNSPETKEQKFVVLNRIEGKNGKTYWSRMGSARSLEKGGLSLFMKHEPHMNYVIKIDDFKGGASNDEDTSF